MSKMFTRQFRVRWSELDATNRVPASKYLEYLSETAYDWGAANNLGFEESKKMRLIWVILETDIRFLHPLHYNDRFDFTIWMVEWRKVRGTRAFELRLKDSDVIVAQGMQQVASLDGDTLRPTAVEGELIDRFRVDKPERFPSERFPKLSGNLSGRVSTPLRIQWGNIDSLAHLNNAEAASFADEVIVQFLDLNGWSPERMFTEGVVPVPKRIHIKYQEQGLWGDKLNVKTYPMEVHQNGATNAVLVERETDGMSIMQAVYHWSLVNLHTDEECELPAELYDELLMVLAAMKGES